MSCAGLHTNPEMAKNFETQLFALRTIEGLKYYKMYKYSLMLKLHSILKPRGCQLDDVNCYYFVLWEINKCKSYVVSAGQYLIQKIRSFISYVL